MNKVKNVIKISIIVILIIMLLLSLLLQCFTISNLLNYEKLDRHIAKGYIDSYKFNDKNLYLKKYIYSNDDNNIIQNYGMITDENIAKIKLCINDFNEKLKSHNKENELDTKSINPGDYIYIKKLKINDNRKTYLIYLYDVESNALYYLYSTK